MTKTTNKSVNALSVDDKQKVKDAVISIAGVLDIIAANRGEIKTILEDIEEATKVPKKLVRRLARTYFKANFQEESEANSFFEDYYVNILEKASPQ